MLLEHERSIRQLSFSLRLRISEERVVIIAARLATRLASVESHCKKAEEQSCDGWVAAHRSIMQKVGSSGMGTSVRLPMVRSLRGFLGGWVAISRENKIQT